MTQNSTRNLMDEFARMQQAIKDSSHSSSVSKQVEAMRDLLKIYNQAEENSPSVREQEIIASIKEFMSSLTIDDCETFGRDLRREIDNIIESRQASRRRYGCENILDDNEYAVKLFERMQESEKEKAGELRRRAALDAAARERVRKAREEAERLEAERIEQEKAAAIADEMEKASVRGFSVPVGDGSSETVSYEVREDKNGDRSIEIPSELSGYKVVQPDVSVTTVESLPVDPSVPQEKPEDAFPGYLSLDEAIKTLKEKKKKITAILQDPTVLDNPAAFSSFTQELVNISSKLDAMNRERTNRKWAETNKESK